MKKTQSITFRYLSIIFVIASLAYLIYVFFKFEDWNNFKAIFQQNSFETYLWLAATIILLPVNILIEAVKWKQVSSKLESLSIVNAIKSVVSGMASGFVTPNRIGDIIGRVSYLQSGNKTKAISLAAINSLTQNIAILILGVPLGFLYITHQNNKLELSSYFFVCLIILIIFIAFLFITPKLADKIKTIRFKKYVEGLVKLSTKNLFYITLLSILRFIVSCIQLFFILKFFNVHLSIYQAVICIPFSYLLITFTPSFAATEGIVRGSWTVLIISAFSGNISGILMSGVGLWLINIILPVVIGNIFLVKDRIRLDFLRM
ncbi:MAG: hypothetical protein BGO29_15790 [Bacteroidales bacterium 36-12]|nr:MAG: hypothetical protein BGO29_15790 [Bacteroidales bacterium 36-12]